jgi:hypothetical protein
LNKEQDAEVSDTTMIREAGKAGKQKFLNQTKQNKKWPF